MTETYVVEIRLTPERIAKILFGLERSDMHEAARYAELQIQDGNIPHRKVSISEVYQGEIIRRKVEARTTPQTHESIDKFLRGE